MIGQTIRKYRKRNGYTQRELAELVGVSVQAISKWERDSGAPDISQIIPLATALKISTDTLFNYRCDTEWDEFERIPNGYISEQIFREQTFSEQNYALLAPYFSSHPHNVEVAMRCLKCLVDLIAGNKTGDRSRKELLEECENYANCVFERGADVDNLFMTRLLLARGYYALGENEKAEQILEKIPIKFGDRLYWEAEIAQADKRYECAMEKCRQSFSNKARYLARCVRMAMEIVIAEDDSLDALQKRMEHEEYLLRVLNALLSGGNYLPCQQIYQKHVMLRGMVRKYIKLGEMDLAVERMEMLLAGRREFNEFVSNQQGRHTMLFEDSDSSEYQDELRMQLDMWVESAVKMIKAVPQLAENEKVKELWEEYEIY